MADTPNTPNPLLDKRNLIDEYKGMPVEDIKRDLSRRAFPYHIAIENFQHDFNIGTIVRNANAFNAKSVNIIGKKHWNKRGAMSTEKYLTVNHHKTLDDFIGWAQSNQLTIIGIDNIPGSFRLADVNFPQNCVLVFGQEGPGLSPEMQTKCSQIIAIEQYGSTRSINVGVASGIVMYEIVKNINNNIQ